MKKLIMIAALAVCAMGFSEVQAQKIIKDASGNVFMDLQDMPSGYYMTTTLNALGPNDNFSYNAVYKKFQIAKADLPTQMTFAEACGAPLSYNGNITITGAQQGTVNTGCKTYSAEGNAGSWRVPTHREFSMMFVLADHLKAAGVTFSEKIYWTSTVGSSSEACYIVWDPAHSNGFGYSSTSGRSSINSVRCVREVN